MNPNQFKWQKQSQDIEGKKPGHISSPAPVESFLEIGRNPGDKVKCYHCSPGGSCQILATHIGSFSCSFSCSSSCSFSFSCSCSWKLAEIQETNCSFIPALLVAGASLWLHTLAPSPVHSPAPPLAPAPGNWQKSRRQSVVLSLLSWWQLPAPGYTPWLTNYKKIFESFSRALFLIISHCSYKIFQ